MAHPWKYDFAAKQKLAAAKKEGQRRYQAEWHKGRYDAIDASNRRNYYRKAHGIPLDAPIMSPAEALQKARDARYGRA